MKDVAPSSKEWRTHASAFVCVFVAMAFFVWQRGRDFPNYDDLSRTVLSEGWARTPYFLTSDVYWLPLPFIARGGMIRLLGMLFGYEPLVNLAGVRLVTALYLAGTGALLSRLVVRVGGTRIWALPFIGFLYISNATTIALSGSGLSEPDSLFWIALALNCLMTGEEREGRFAVRFVLAGVALMLAGFVRFENWSFAAILLFIYGRRVLHSDPLRRVPVIAASAIAAIPAIIWVGASIVRFGDPFHFLHQASSYLGEDRAASGPIMAAKALFRPFGLFTPLVAWAAWRGFQLLDPKHRTPILSIVIAMLAWTALKLNRMNAHERFIWEPFMLCLIPAALAFEKAVKGESGARRFAMAYGGSLLWVFAMINGAYDTVSHIQPELRRFADDVRREAHGKTVLLRGVGSGAGEDEILQVLRIWLGHENAIPCHWVGGCESISDSEIKRYNLGLILVRNPSGAQGENPPLFTGPDGWVAFPASNSLAARGARSL